MEYLPRHLVTARCLRDMLVFQAFPLGSFFTLPASAWGKGLRDYAQKELADVAHEIPVDPEELEFTFHQISPLVESIYGISLTHRVQNHRPFWNMWAAIFSEREAQRHVKELCGAFLAGDHVPATVVPLYNALAFSPPFLSPYPVLHPEKLAVLAGLYQAQLAVPQAAHVPSQYKPYYSLAPGHSVLKDHPVSLN